MRLLRARRVCGRGGEREELSRDVTFVGHRDAMGSRPTIRELYVGSSTRGVSGNAFNVDVEERGNRRRVRRPIRP
jgi:hypothetical protein